MSSSGIPKKTFWERYSSYCLRDKLYPSPVVKKYLDGTELRLPVEAIRSDHFHHVCSCLCVDNDLTKVHFASWEYPDLESSTDDEEEEEEEEKEKDNNSKKRKNDPASNPYRRNYINLKLMYLSLATMLRFSQKLVVLKLENLPMSPFEAKQLALGLSETRTLRLLSLAACKLEEGVLKIICHAVSMSYITWLDLSAVYFAEDGMKDICDMIKAHGIRKANQVFPKTLRNSIVDLEELKGIYRISFNSHFINENMLAILVEGLADDIFIRAIDMQRCGIDNQGAQVLKKLVTTNRNIEIIDLRANESIDKVLLEAIDHQLNLNRAGKTQRLEYTPMWKNSDITRKYASKPARRMVLLRDIYRYKRRMTRSGHHSTKSHDKNTDKIISKVDASVQTPIYLDPLLPENIEDAVFNLRDIIQKEKKLRHFYEAKCKQLEKQNTILKGYLQSQNDDIYIDQETYFEIKHTFEKLKIFFDVMKKYGSRIVTELPQDTQGCQGIF